MSAIREDEESSDGLGQGKDQRYGNAPAAARVMMPILLLSQPSQDDLVGLGVPDPRENLFTRIIRDPTRLDRPMRETRCTEMLCSVLMNCPSLRGLIFRWMADAGGEPSLAPDDMDELCWNLATESFIGSKRDDLRIEGWRSVPDGDDRLEVLWTIEVKVQAYFHQSTDETGLDTGGEDDEDEGGRVDDDSASEGNIVPSDTDASEAMVNQLINYDAWLADRDVPCKAGFVLAIPNHQQDLPEGLKCRWACLTWTGLGQLVKGALEKDAVAVQERMLAQQLLGFIHQHLWRREEMADAELTFDHVALLRAHWAIGLECESIINKMVEPLMELLRQSKLGLKDPYHQKSLLRGWQRSAVYGHFVSAENVALFAGVTEGTVRVWIETTVKYEHKDKLRAKFKSILPGLNDGSPKWMVNDSLGQWHDLYAQKPLFELLAEPDQTKAVRDFVAGALADLKAAEIDRIIERVCNGISA